MKWHRVPFASVQDHRNEMEKVYHFIDWYLDARRRLVSRHSKHPGHSSDIPPLA